MKVESPKFEFWAGFRTLTPVIYGESGTPPLQSTCQIAYRSSETQVKLRSEPPKFEFWAGLCTPTLAIYGGSETLPLQITCQIVYRSSDPRARAPLFVTHFSTDSYTHTHPFGPISNMCVSLGMRATCLIMQPVARPEGSVPQLCPVVPW